MVDLLQLQIIEKIQQLERAPEDYLQTLNKQDYAGFNLLLRDSSGVHYLSNRGGDRTQINNGVNALGNRILNSPTNKVKNVSDSFKELLHCNFTKEDLIRQVQSFLNTEDSLKDINTSVLEDLILEYKYINKAEVYLDLNKVVHIYISFRERSGVFVK